MSDCFIKESCLKYVNNCCLHDEDKFCVKYFKCEKLYDMALLSDKQRKVTKLSTEQIDKEMYDRLKKIKANIIDFVNNGNNLYIYSSITGNGKTEWAIKFIQAYINEIWSTSEITCRALFINVPKFLLSLKANISEKNEYITHIMKYINSADIIVWDDIGSKVGTEYEIENMLALINNRIDNGKSNIFTSNITPTNLSEIIGPRLASRVKGCSEPIEFNGHDKRGINR